MKLTPTAGLAMLLAPIVPLMSQTPPGRPPAILTELTDCRKTADDAARLACYDRGVARLEAATTRRDVVIVDREDIRQTRRSLFGFTLPRIGLFGDRGPKDGPGSAQEEISEIETTVTRAEELPNGRYQLVLATNGTWRTTESWAGAKLPVSGTKILVRRGALGNYFLRIQGGRPIRGMRVG